MIPNVYQLELGGRHYSARILGGKVAQLHRIFPRAVLVGGEYKTFLDDFRSISANAKGRAELDAEILKHVAIIDALEIAVATVELNTGNGAQSQPAGWPRAANGEDIDYEAVARLGRAALATVGR